jgi:predicted RNase H-like HicB family nuclease
MRFWIRIYRHGKDYGALVPDLPGCVAAADSVEEVRKLITQAIHMHLDLMRRSGEKVPAPRRHFELDVDELEKEEICTWVDIEGRRGKKLKKQIVGGRK